MRRADPRHLGLGDPRFDPERLDQVVDLSGGDPVDVGLHDDCVEGLVDPPAALENRGEEAPLPELGDLSSTSPALEDRVLFRCPLRRVVRVIERS